MGRRGYSRLKLLILDMLSSRAMHGYAIMKEFEALFGSPPSPGTIYPLLREMLREGLVEVRISGSSGRIVKTYYITEKGRQYLASRGEEVREVKLLLEGLRIAKGHGLTEVFEALMRLVRLLPELPEELRLRVLGFLEKVRSEAQGLLEEVEAHA